MFRKEEVQANLDRLIGTCVLEAPVLSEIAAGEITLDNAVAIARRHYAEVRTFIDLKLPSRMRLCDSKSNMARKFFWEVYAEECGQFIPGADHASIFAEFCRSIGLSQDDLDLEYLGYWPNFAYLLSEQPSHEIVVREMAISYAWETMAPRLAVPMTVAVRAILAQLGMSSQAHEARYFKDHVEVDAHHGSAAFDALLACVATDDDLSLVEETIVESVVEHNPWVLPLWS